MRTKKATEVTKTVVCEFEGVRREGRYVLDTLSPKSKCWTLTHWRIRSGKNTEFSEWKKVHGNRRQQCGGFRLFTDPTEEEYAKFGSEGV